LFSGSMRKRVGGGKGARTRVDKDGEEDEDDEAAEVEDGEENVEVLEPVLETLFLRHRLSLGLDYGRAQGLFVKDHGQRCPKGLDPTPSSWIKLQRAAAKFTRGSFDPFITWWCVRCASGSLRKRGGGVGVAGCRASLPRRS